MVRPLKKLAPIIILLFTTPIPGLQALREAVEGVRGLVLQLSSQLLLLVVVFSFAGIEEF